MDYAVNTFSGFTRKKQRGFCSRRSFIVILIGYRSSPHCLSIEEIRAAMFATANSQPRLLRRQLSPVALVRITLDPLIVIGTLFVVAQIYGETFEGAYLVLSLIVFSLTFPASPPGSTGSYALLKEIFVNWLAIVIILLIFGWATRSLTVFPHEVLITWGLSVPVVAFAVHRTLPVLLPKILALEGVQRSAVIVGAGELGHKLAQQIDASTLGIRLLGFFDDRGKDRLGVPADYQMLGNIGNLAEFVKRARVDLIYVTLPMASQPRILRLLDGLRDTTASIYFTPDIFLFDLIQARMDSLNGIPLVAICETPFYGVNGLIKRLSDIVLASLILILISPLMLAIAIGIKLSSPGPVLFRQRRYGLDGREIVVYKFRSMTVCEDGTDVIRQATKNDQRVTRLGAFLRRTSLDELPQFINVLQGRMSVVGPRPHAVAHNEMYRKLIKGYMIRHKVKPGITGWAQVNGLRGETESLDKMKARIDYDLAYLRNWSLRLDLAIILKTVFVVLKGNNAY